MVDALIAGFIFFCVLDWILQNVVAPLLKYPDDSEDPKGGAS